MTPDEALILIRAAGPEITDARLLEILCEVSNTAYGEGYNNGYEYGARDD